MRNIYFVRHGVPDFPGGEKMCIGTTDVPLSTLGKLQACITGAFLRKQGFSAVYSSPLSRAFDTAKMICPKPVIVDGLREMYAGDWEGQTFRHIKEKWPELYYQRGENINLPIPGAESLSDVRKRFSVALSGIISDSRGDIVIVSHITSMQSYLCEYMGIPLSACRDIRIPYCSVSVLVLGGEQPVLKCIGTVPVMPMSEELCTLIMAASGAGEEIYAHCRKVADKAAYIADEAGRAGYDLDKERIIYAALLHDVARREPNHAAAGGRWLSQLGYEDIGKLVSCHHDILPVEVNEAAVLSFADRCILGIDDIGIEERFSRSAGKCVDDEGKAAHMARYENAKALEALFHRFM